MKHLRRSVGSPVAWAATAVFVAVMVLWTIVTPGFRNPDEPQHVNSVLRVAEGGGWPAPADAYMAPEVLRAKTLTGFSAIDGQSGNWAGGTLLPGVRPTIPEADLQYFALFSSQTPTAVEDREQFDELELSPGVDLTQHGDQMTQHPPLYYAVNAAVVKATGALDWRFDRAMALMRLVSVLLVAPLPLMAFTVVQRLTGRRRLADLAAVLPLAIPQLAALGGSVTNDAMVIALGGLLTVLLARILTGDRGWKTLIGAAVVLGLALLTKGTMLAAVPVAGLAVVVGARRAPQLPWRATLIRLVGLWVPAFLVGGWWYGLNYLRYGTIQPAGIPEDGLERLIIDRPRSSVFEYAGIFWDKITGTFWGTFGQLELHLPTVLVVGLSVALLVAVVLSLRGRTSRLPLLVLLAFCGVMLVALFLQTYLSHLGNGRYAGIQGRYLYGGLVALIAAIALGIGGATRPGGRVERWLPTVALLGSSGLAAYGLWVGFQGYYIDIDYTVAQGWARMIEWSPWPSWAVNGLALGIVLLTLAALAVSVVSALRTGGDTEPVHPADDAPSTGNEPDGRGDGVAPTRSGEPRRGEPAPTASR